MPDASAPAPFFFSDFSGAFSALLSEASCKILFAAHGPRGGGTPKLTPWQWLMARVYHEFARSGTFAANVKTITRVTISNSALSQRACSIGWKLIQEILPAVLRPLADPIAHASAFHRGLRLVALDGTRLNLRNTPAINAQARKTPCSRGGGVPAFAHLLGVVLLELGLHQPLAAAFGWQGEGELTLTRQILARRSLPEARLEGRVPLNVFLSYSHKDKKAKTIFQDNLTVMTKKNLLMPWHDGLIEAGMRWREEIEESLTRMDIFVGLLTTAFIVSDFIETVELKAARKATRSGERSFIHLDPRR